MLRRFLPLAVLSVVAALGTGCAATPEEERADVATGGAQLGAR